MTYDALQLKKGVVDTFFNIEVIALPPDQSAWFAALSRYIKSRASEGWFAGVTTVHCNYEIALQATNFCLLELSLCSF